VAGRPAALSRAARRGQGKAARSLDRWIPTREELLDYLPRVGELLGTTALRTQRKKVLAGNYATLFRNLVLTTAWQESCWRQFVRRGKEVSRSPRRSARSGSCR
jgi:hypothetical protein